MANNACEFKLFTMSIKEYWRKRDFNKTAEPRGKKPALRKDSEALPFVIQKHDASRLHYDLRLEFDGVLKSWAVPKGPSLDPKEKRLAVEVEDHPLEYASFEGIIPEGEYGAGSVIVWDRGVWIADVDPRKAFQKGNIKFELRGEKLHGHWALVRMKRRERDKSNNWLLIKERDAYAKPLEELDVLKKKPRSVISGKEVEDIATKPGSRGKEPREWRANR